MTTFSRFDKVRVTSIPETFVLLSKLGFDVNTKNNDNNDAYIVQLFCVFKPTTLSSSLPVDFANVFFMKDKSIQTIPVSSLEVIQPFQRTKELIDALATHQSEFYLQYVEPIIRIQDNIVKDSIDANIVRIALNSSYSHLNDVVEELSKPNQSTSEKTLKAIVNKIKAFLPGKYSQSFSHKNKS